MAETMTNDEIMSEFEQLFGTGSSDEDTATDDTAESVNDEPEEKDSEETAGESVEEAEKESPEKEAEDSKEAPVEDKKQSKQNYAFAEQRLQIKKNEQFIRSLGKLIGFDDKATVDQIQDKIKEVLIEREAKQNNISVELAKRLDRAEELIQENDRIKLEKKVHEGFLDLIDKHNLDEAAVNDFTAYLIDHGKNPMEGKEVDLEAEYLKLHYDDMVKAAVADALAKEEARRKKVEDKAPSGVSKSPGDKDDAKISSVRDLDDLFANTNL